VAVAFGVVTILSGGRALFGSLEARAAVGNAVPFVLWFNFGAGFAYVTAGIGLLMRRDWAAWLSSLIAVATLLVFAGFGLFVLEGGAYEFRTVVAMSIRSVFWLLVTIVAHLLVRNADTNNINRKALPK
jgi:hypothetical protein